MDLKNLGSKLKANRAKCGWTISDCSKRIGITARYLSDIESGKKLPKLETFITILNTLSASADEVLQDSLTVGYEAKSDAILKKLETLDPAYRKQALDIFESILATLKDS